MLLSSSVSSSPSIIVSINSNFFLQVFHGNTGRNDIVKHNLEEVIIASFVRFQPTDFFGHKALRVELYGALKSLGNS